MTNISQSLPHIAAGKGGIRNYRHCHTILCDLRLRDMKQPMSAANNNTVLCLLFNKQVQLYRPNRSSQTTQEVHPNI